MIDDKKHRFLLIFHDREMREFVYDILKTELKEMNVIIDEARCEDEAKERLQDQAYDLIITHLLIPVDSESSPSHEEKRGLVFLRSLKEEHINIPTILVSDTADYELFNAVQKINQCKLVQSGSSLEDNLIENSKEALASVKRDECIENIKEKDKIGIEKEKRVNLDITLDLNKRDWHYSLKGVGFFYEDCGPLQIDADMMFKLARRSKKVKGDDWEEDLHEVGEDLMKEIFDNNPKLTKSFYQLIGEVGGIKNTKIRFIVEEAIHSVALEALVEKDGINRYWMLELPIYRRLDIKGVRPPLFKDKETKEKTEPINCLIVEADTGGYYSNIIKEELGLLENVKEECEFLEKYLLDIDNKSQFNIGKVERIKEAPDDNSFWNKVQGVLESDKWHLIHYAGHSYYDDKKHMGYFFFPQKDPGDAEEIKIERFNIPLRKSETRFIYLSSCHSSEEDFVFKLASQGIPSIVGFRWDIDDELAVEYTKVFYENLFKKRALEYAFLEARRYMHDNYEDNKIWAAPMLIMQVG